jgi:hypothetical protein
VSRRIYQSLVEGPAKFWALSLYTAGQLVAFLGLAEDLLTLQNHTECRYDETNNETKHIIIVTFTIIAPEVLGPWITLSS